MNERTNVIGMETGCGRLVSGTAGRTAVRFVVVRERAWKRADAVSTR